MAVVISDASTVSKIYYAVLFELLQILGAEATIGKDSGNYL